MKQKSSHKKIKPQWIIGVDEVGRGPLAGPVTVCAFAIPSADWKKFNQYGRKHGLTDSKKLTPEKREKWSAYFKQQQKNKKVIFCISSATAATIDSKGISKVIESLVERSLTKLQIDSALAEVKLDGSLKAPEIFTNQETIIKGDAKHMAIAAASVAAKVYRDNYMKLQARKYPVYGFDIHKGYGTKKHRLAIATQGFCPLHRRTFCKNC